MATFEANWLTETQLRLHLDTLHAREWMLDKGSLTQRLIDHCEGEFAVSLRREEEGRPLRSESRLLGLPECRLAIIREVDLLCRGTPLVFARTVIPFPSLRGRTRSLAGLGTRPLGAMLFQDPTTRREIVQYAKIRPGQSLHVSATRNLGRCPETLMARRTLFCYKGRPLLVNEIFLPTLLESVEKRA